MAKVSSVGVYPSDITVKMGQWSYRLAAEVCPENAASRDVIWTSDNVNVASVNKTTGDVYGVSAGTTKIWATATDGVSLTHNKFLFVAFDG